MIDLLNDGSGLGFGIIGGKSTGVVVKTILPGGVADKVSIGAKYTLHVVVCLLKCVKCPLFGPVCSYMHTAIVKSYVYVHTIINIVTI